MGLENLSVKAPMEYKGAERKETWVHWNNLATSGEYRTGIKITETHIYTYLMVHSGVKERPCAVGVDGLGVPNVHTGPIGDQPHTFKVVNEEWYIQQYMKWCTHEY